MPGAVVSVTTVLGVKIGRCLEPSGLPLSTTVSFRFSVKSVFEK